MPVLIGLNYLEEGGICLYLASSGYLKAISEDFYRFIKVLLEHLLYHLQPQMTCFHLRNQ